MKASDFSNTSIVATSHHIETSGYKSCYHTHPALPLGNGLVIYGGNCGNPVVKDANIYIGFERTLSRLPASFPWNGGQEINYPVTDMCAPSDPKEYLRLVEWTIKQLIEGKKIHAGCIGGHGRTGMFFAAIARVVTDDKDAITYVRKHYCDRAVESTEQINFLNKHYGIKKVKGSKTYDATVKSGKKPQLQSLEPWANNMFDEPGESIATVFSPMACKSCIWGPTI